MEIHELKDAFSKLHSGISLEEVSLSASPINLEDDQLGNCWLRLPSKVLPIGDNTGQDISMALCGEGIVNEVLSWRILPNKQVLAYTESVTENRSGVPVLRERVPMIAVTNDTLIYHVYWGRLASADPSRDGRIGRVAYRLAAIETAEGGCS